MLAGDVEVLRALVRRRDRGKPWDEDAGVRGLTTDRVRVERAARLGYAAMRTALDAVA